MNRCQLHDVEMPEGTVCLTCALGSIAQAERRAKIESLDLVVEQIRIYKHDGQDVFLREALVKHFRSVKESFIES